MTFFDACHSNEVRCRAEDLKSIALDSPPPQMRRGFAIIGYTLLIKLLTYPLNQYSLRRSPNPNLNLLYPTSCKGRG